MASPKTSTNRWFSIQGSLACTLLGAAFAALGCGGELPDGEDGGSGGPDLDICVGGCNGVYVACANPGSIPTSPNSGADGSSGGQGGGEGGAAPDNYYWTQCDPGTPPDRGCRVGAEWCCDSNFDVCYCKTYDNSDGPTPQSIGNACVGNGRPPGLDAIGDWMTGTYPRYESAIRPHCEQKCNELNRAGIGFDPPECEAASFGIPITPSGWEPSDGFNCSVPDELNENDPYGIGVPWSSVGGGSTPLPLSCDLTDDCADSFVPSARPYVVNTPEAGLITPETRGARHLAFSFPGASPEFSVSVDYASTRHDVTHPVYGSAEFSHDECGEAVCPFFQASLSANNMSDSWTVPVKLDTGSTVTRTFSDLRVELMQSTLGIENISLGKVAFAPGALRLGIEFEIAGTGYGSGHHSFVTENDGFVFADVTFEGLDLDYSFALQALGTATLSLPLAADEHPPVATHDIPTGLGAPRRTCSVTLPSSSLLSTDPDGDIEDEYWLVDGAACGETCVVGPGVHDVQVVAVDTRGAVDMRDLFELKIFPC